MHVKISILLSYRNITKYLVKILTFKNVDQGAKTSFNIKIICLFCSHDLGIYYVFYFFMNKQFDNNKKIY